ncbi:MAG: tellurite resistance protein and related permease-like protein [Blastococcus sp.]|nr:tellurite resistance protein and related permease-like protein [Blastococcus sp.]
MNPSSLLRSLATATAPLTVVAVGLVVATAATGGAAVESSPFAIASTAVLMIALLGIGAAALLGIGRLRNAGRSIAPPVVAVVGTVLVAGGQWAALFVLPALSEHAPQVLASGAMGSVTVGYVASYAVFALGWIATAAGLLRARVVPVWLGVLLLVGGVASFVPAPEALRLLIVSIAATLVARRITAPAPVQELATASA